MNSTPMNIKLSFSYKGAVRSAIALVLDNFSTFFYISLIWWASWFLMGLIQVALAYAVHTSNTPAFSVGSYVVTFFHNLCENYMHYQILCFGLSAQKGEKIRIRNAFSNSSKNFVRFFIARLLVSIEIVVGLIFFIIPGVYSSLKYYFAGYSILENSKISLSDDRYASSTLTTGVKGKLLGVYAIHICSIVAAFITALLSIIMPPLFVVSVVIRTALELIDLEIFRQLKNKASTPTDTQ